VKTARRAPRKKEPAPCYRLLPPGLPTRRVDIVHLWVTRCAGRDQRGPAIAAQQEPCHRERRDGEQSNPERADTHLPVMVTKGDLANFNNSGYRKRDAVNAALGVLEPIGSSDARTA
jgi:hypothetical protein